MSTLNVDKVDPSTGTALEIGSSGDTITIPSGATIVNSGTATGFGAALTGSTDNQVTTVTAANAIQGETNLTYDGTILGCGATGAAADLGVGVHIRTADSGASVDSGADELVIESDTHGGMTFLNSTSTKGLIYFGDSGDNDIGGIEYNHSADSMSLITNTAEGLKISSDGEVTKPLQPYFNVYPSVLQTNMTTGSGVTVVWGTEVKDIGGNFASNTFTAPVTGIYAFSCLLNLNQYDTAASYVWLQMPSSNEATNVSITGPVLGGSDGYYHLNGTCIIDMDASDTVTVVYLQAGGTAQVDVLDVSSHWYGYLLG